MRDPALASPAVLAYGRLAIATLAGVTTASAAALTLVLGRLLSAPGLTPGPPYAEAPLALLAIGAAAGMACLAAAAAYFAQVAVARGAVRLTRAMHAATVLLMSAAFLAFGIGGAVFSHFELAAAAALGRQAAAR